LIRVIFVTIYVSMPLLASAKARLQRAKAAQREREAAEKTEGSPEPEAAVQAKVKSYGDALEQYDVAQANKFHGKLQQATPSSKFHLQSGTAGTMIGTARANSVASSAAGYNEECLVPHVAAASAEGLHLRLAMVVLWQAYRFPIYGAAIATQRWYHNSYYRLCNHKRVSCCALASASGMSAEYD
jgi:hypothetical protein